MVRGWEEAHEGTYLFFLFVDGLLTVYMAKMIIVAFKVQRLSGP